jgi:hypothetical protein
MRTIFIFFFVVCSANKGWVQTTNIPFPPSGLKYKVTYTLEETTFHMAPEGGPGSGLSPIDLDKLRINRIVKQVERRISEDNHHSSTIVILNPEEAYSEFPHKIGRIEMNQTGMQIFGTDNNLYLAMPADSSFQADYNTMRTRHSNSEIQLMSVFPSAPDAQSIQHIQMQGGAVTLLANSAWQINFSGFSTLFEPTEHRITSSRFEGGQLHETRVQKYVYTSQGIYAPLEDLTKRKVIRPSGACMEDVVRKRYSNYAVAIASSERNVMDRQTRTSPGTIQPNPTEDFLNIMPGDNVLPGSILQVFDVVGELVYEQSQIETGIEITIPISGMKDGIYFVRLQTTTGPQSLKFVKKAH